MKIIRSSEKSKAGTRAPRPIGGRMLGVECEDPVFRRPENIGRFYHSVLGTKRQEIRKVLSWDPFAQNGLGVAKVSIEIRLGERIRPLGRGRTHRRKQPSL